MLEAMVKNQDVKLQASGIEIGYRHSPEGDGPGSYYTRIEIWINAIQALIPEPSQFEQIITSPTPDIQYFGIESDVLDVSSQTPVTILSGRKNSAQKLIL